MAAFAFKLNFSRLSQCFKNTLKLKITQTYKRLVNSGATNNFQFVEVLQPFIAKSAGLIAARRLSADCSGGDGI
jgi:hypothetical protein